jgi:hypothetical protein
MEINLTIVLDGVVPDKKDKTSRQRKLKIASDMRKLFNNQPLQKITVKLMPLVMGTHLFRDVTRVFSNIEIIQAPYEADSYIGKLAQTYIPGTYPPQYKYFGVISNDSDFMVYDSAGFISQSHMQVRWNKKDEKYNIFISRYTPDMIRKVLGLTHNSMIPLVACLSGNDYMQVSSFANYHKRLIIQYQKETNKEDVILMEEHKDEKEQVDKEEEVLDILDKEEEESTSKVENLATKIAPKQVEDQSVNILQLISRHVSEHFAKEEQKGEQIEEFITVETATKLFHLIFKKKEKVDKCAELYRDYVVRELDDDHTHFNYETLFSNYIPFYNKARLHLNDEEHTYHRSEIIRHCIERFKAHFLSNEVVTIAAHAVIKLPIPTESPDNKITTHEFYRLLRRRFYAYIYFHDMNHPRTRAALEKNPNIIIIESVLHNGDYIDKNVVISKDFYDNNYLNDEAHLLDKKTELLRVYGITSRKGQQFLAFMSEAKKLGKLPGDVNAHCIILLIINMMFMLRSREETDIQDWEYQIFLVSLCRKPYYDELAPCQKLASTPGAARFVKKLYQEKNADVLNLFIHRNFYTIISRFLIGLKLFSFINQWFDDAFPVNAITNATLMFNGSNFAKLYLKAYKFQCENEGKKRFNIEIYLRSDLNIQTYETLVDAMEIIANPLSN